MTETASESVRDALSRWVTQADGWQNETSSEEIETRHAHTLSLTEGDQNARREKAYRLIPMEEEQISKPYWVNYLRIGLLLLLLLIPQAFTGMLTLLNRLFDASEAVNPYVYEHYMVSSEASVPLAGILIVTALVSVMGIILITGSRGLLTAAVAVLKRRCTAIIR